MVFRVLSSRWGAFRKSLKTWATAHPHATWTLSALTWLPLGIVFTQSFYTLKVVAGRSMQPTLNPDDSQWKDIVVFDRFAAKTQREFKRGDIVALKSPYDTMYIVKRIIALPGDTVKTLPPYPDAEVVIPEGHIWVEGDESFHTEDSNTFGPVPLALVDSKLSFIIWPPARYGPIEEPTRPNPKGKRGPSWRKEMDAYERENRRQSRVTPANSQDIPTYSQGVKAAL